MSVPDWANWFRTVWSRSSRAVISDCIDVGVDHKHFLADLALRGNVYAPIKENDPIALARAEGRRQLALETIKLCNTDPQALWALLDPLPNQRGDRR